MGAPNPVEPVHNFRLAVILPESMDVKSLGCVKVDDYPVGPIR